MANYIQSIQAFSINIASGSTTNTATISAVTTANAVIYYDGCEGSSTNTPSRDIGSAILTDTTTVTATRGNGAASDCTVKGRVVEYTSSAMGTNSAQTATISITSTNSTASATISAVTSANAALLYGGLSYTGSSVASSTFANIIYASTTSVTATRTGTSSQCDVVFTAVDFASAVIQSVQNRSVTLTSSNTTDADTISAVTTANTMLFYNGVLSSLTSLTNFQYYIALTSTTNVNLVRQGTSTTSKTVKYQAFEHASGVLVSMQRGTTDLSAGNASNTTTITSVTTTQTALNFNNFSTDQSSTTNVSSALPDVNLASATSVGANRNNTGGDALTAWEVAEYTATGGIAFDAAANSGDQAAASSYSGSASWSGTDRLLAIDVSMLGPGVTVTAMTYGGANCTFIGAISTATSFGRVEQWRIVSSDSGAPAAGSNTLSVTLSGSLEFAVEWVSYTGVHQNSPTEAFNSAQATNVGAADATVDITTVADNCWVHGAIAVSDTSITAGQTSRNNISGTLGSGANEDNNAAKTPAGAVTMSYTGVGALATWAIAGYAIRPVAASPINTVVAAQYANMNNFTRFGIRVG